MYIYIYIIHKLSWNSCFREGFCCCFLFCFFGRSVTRVCDEKEVKKCERKANAYNNNKKQRHSLDIMKMLTKLTIRYHKLIIILLFQVTCQRLLPPSLRVHIIKTCCPRSNQHFQCRDIPPRSLIPDNWKKVSRELTKRNLKGTNWPKKRYWPKDVFFEKKHGSHVGITYCTLFQFRVFWGVSFFYSILFSPHPSSAPWMLLPKKTIHTSILLQEVILKTSP